MGETKTDKSIDLKGEVCPFTFVMTKAYLEEMESGVLEVIVDYPPAAENIPKSVEAQRLGKILKVEHIEKNEYRIVIQK